ncbi:MAG: xanthine phosphoribosyltransferase [Lachnospiraceae bacterium]|nr:xanthine phosphoribosyltransferase [Lachnospiraceae bacterium]
MKQLEEKILKEGKVLPGNILQVGSFLNQQLDTDFICEMGHEIARLFADEPITKIVTIEASGISIAFAAAAVMHVPVVFAKKSLSANVSGEVYSARVHSFTHGNDFTAVIAKPYLSASDTVLLVDDFLAMGEALRGLIAILDQSGAKLAGCAIAIEKAFQGGGDKLRAEGIRVESLACIDSMTADSLTFRENG